MKQSERGQALKILLRLLQNQQAFAQTLQDPNLPPFSKTLCFGVARYYYRLEAMADSLVTKRPKDLEVWICLLLGLLQISILKMPEYAVVQETVGLLSPKQAWAKAFVNAILRRFCREQDLILQHISTQSAFQTMHPEWLVKKIQHAWPNHWQAILDANNQHPPFSIRVHLRHTSLEQYRTRLDDAQMAYSRIAHTQAGLIIEPACSVQRLPGFLEGACSIQDGAAQLAGPLLELKPGLRVLDACCAPGGKLSQILECEPGLATCIGLDVDAKRLVRVQENCTRLGLQALLKQGDASQPQVWWDGQRFDRILLDAPCSATGIIRRHPDIKIIRNAAEIEHIRQVQAQILKALWPLLARGGLLVYATCSIMPEENEQQISAFLQAHPDATAEIGPQTWGHPTGHGWQILPGEQGMDGFFYAKIKKN